MPDEKKRELVELLARHELPLIEDDVYGELHFGTHRPAPAKAYDRRGLVLHCSSFSKTLAPGYRIGWAAAGRYTQQVARLKLTNTLATCVPAQLAIARYLQRGSYERHLRRLRTTLAAQQSAYLAAVAEHFPPGTRVTRPDGGYFLWIELPEDRDALRVHREAARRGISIAPGPIFSAHRGHAHCLRLNYGHPLDARVAAALRVLGQLSSARSAPA